MPRSKREISESGFYHITVRGNGQQIIFEGDHDRSMFLKYLINARDKTKLKIIAWCLMDNHVHLLVEDEHQAISKLMHSLSSAYAVYFNRKHGRVGHLFQDRFSSTPVGADAHLLEAVQYIHNNPAKAGICQMEDYPWSSFGEYVRGGEITSTSLVLGMLGGIDQFILFSRNHAPVQSLDKTLPRRLKDEKALEVAQLALCKNGIKGGLESLKTIDVKKRNDVLLELSESGLSIRQMQRLTGIGRHQISQALAKMH